MNDTFSKTGRRVLFLLLAAAWLLPGTVARSPWKADEAYTFGLVLHVFQTGDWVIPQLGGEPFMQKPPILLITAAICGKLLGGLLGMETAFRVAVLIFQTLTLVFLGVGARELNGPGSGWFAPVLLMGCLGFVHLSHMLITDLSLVTGFAIAFAGLALANRRPIMGGIILGTGTGIAFMSKGLIGPGLIGLTAMLLPICFRNWRTRAYGSSLGVAALAALPWLLIWPLAVYERSPELFKQWFLDNNLGRFLGPAMFGRENKLGLHNSRFNFFLALPWFAWPAFPFACLALWKERREMWRQPGVQLNLVALVVMLLVLSVSRNGRSLYGLPLLVPACLLGARGVALIAPRWTVRLRVAVGVVFGVAMAAMWVGWLIQFAGQGSSWWQQLQEKIPGYQPVFQPGAFVAALLASAGWVWWMWRQPRSESCTVALNWCAGLSLVYLLVMTLFLPLAETNMSYRHLAPLRQLTLRIHGCVMSEGLGEPQRAMLDYYAGLKTTRLEIDPQADCDWLVTQTDLRNPHGRDAKGPPWKLVWESVHSRKELFRLYQRDPALAPAKTGQP